MDIVPAKRREFKPVILYLPGYERTEKQLINEKPELWKIFKRLSATQKPIGGRKSNSPCGDTFNPTTFVIPNKAGMRCMCYENMMRIITDRITIPPPITYRLSNGKTLPMKTDGLFPTWTQKAIQSFRDNEERQYPLSTLIVRWRLKRHLPTHDKSSIHQTFERFGPITEIQTVSPNSCLVIFAELKSACHVMETRYIGECGNKINCSWWHKSMGNKTMIARETGLKIRTHHCS